MSEGKEKEIEANDQKQAEELSPEDMEKTSGGAFDAFMTFDPKSPGRP